ncbi:Glycine--tRNA ligase beta subunit [Gossypium arboreum]|uniref:Glycine--tRNA ligase beta subunit n=1 Tax=Gossypium arboreum TaxID=29729 RepID=A0A0B0MCL2_GOSAR|nr:Glycine--tRNA ligase beta subunit [Gossypium arboreum]
MVSAVPHHHSCFSPPPAPPSRLKHVWAETTSKLMRTGNFRFANDAVGSVSVFVTRYRGMIRDAKEDLQHSTSYFHKPSMILRFHCSMFENLKPYNYLSKSPSHTYQMQSLELDAFVSLDLFKFLL